MSALGQKRTSRLVEGMSALPPKADITDRSWHVRFVPKADISSIWIYRLAIRAPEVRPEMPEDRAAHPDHPWQPAAALQSAALAHLAADHILQAAARPPRRRVT